MFDELHGRAHVVEGRDFKNVNVIQPTDDALILIFAEQRFEHGTGFLTVFGKNIALLDAIGALATRQRRLVEGDVADQIEGVEVFADFFH